MLGTGALGAAIAARLSDTGHQVKLWNRTPDRARAAAAARPGVIAVEDVTEAVKDAPVVLTLLRDGDAVATVMGTAIDSLAAGTVWVQASTIGPDSARAQAELAATHRVAYLDAPVSGSTGTRARLASWSGWSPAARTHSTWPSRPCSNSGRPSNISAPASRAAPSRSPSTPDDRGNRRDERRLSLCDALGINHQLFAKVLQDGPTADAVALQK